MKNNPCFATVKVEVVDDQGKAFEWKYSDGWTLRALRRFLGLRLGDVEHATGIPRGKLAAAEAGRVRLNVPAAGMLRAFLLARLRVMREYEVQDDTQSESSTVAVLPKDLAKSEFVN